MNCQYPNWKTSEKVISVPTARLPKMFLQNVQLSKQFQKRFNATQKGEDGEIKVYKQFVNELKLENEGLIVLPNVDGSHVFETGGIGSVEIDMIVAHPLKGIFNFNVKNSQNISAEKMKQETLKHNWFLRYLAGFNFQSQNLENSCSSNSSSKLSVPIHSVFCDLHGNSSKKMESLKNSTDLKLLKNDCVLTFQKSDFQKTEDSNFALRWMKVVETIPNMPTESIVHFDRLVARLVAINSMEGAVSLVHQQIATNDMQSVNVKINETEKRIDEQLSDISFAHKESKKELIVQMKTMSEPTKKGEKLKVILWTKEQLEIISYFFEYLTHPTDQPLRLLVVGPMGSGKTMLMLYLARLTKAIFKSKLDVFISHGQHAEPKILLEQIKKMIELVDIPILSELSDVVETTKGLIFVDEFDLTMLDRAEQINENLHFCCFTAERFESNRASKLERIFFVLDLTHTLRSTRRLGEFQKDYVYQTKSNYAVIGLPSHNLEGETIPSAVHVNQESTELNQECFVTSCMDAIEKCIVLSKSADSILVSFSFLTPLSQKMLSEEMIARDWRLRSTAFPHLNAELLQKTILPRKNSPLIWLENSDTVLGAEFGSVVFIYEKGSSFGCHEFKWLYNFITRATTYLTIVINHTPIWSLTLYVNMIHDSHKYL